MTTRLFASLSILAALSGFANAAPHLRNDLEGFVASDTKEQESDNVYSSYTPAAEKDRILKLPGLEYDPGFNQFSGYLTVSQRNGRNIFYWYVESQHDPANDPVVFWTNGGPGCSGLLGLGTEHGPFIIDKNGSLRENPFSWNKVASILYVEQPAGVGFSYSDTEEDYKTGDDKASADNYALILEFLTRFPERQSNDFVIASESYGGHYMPQLAMEILKHNTDGLIKFRGFLVGNPYVDPFTNTLTQFASFYAHGLLAKPLYDKFVKSCSTPRAIQTTKCQDLQDQMLREFGDGINPYALDFPICTEADDASYSPRMMTTSSQAQNLLHHMQIGPPFLPDKDEYHPCEEEHLRKYLNNWGVQTALHVHVGSEWNMCSSVLHYDWKDVNTPQIGLYQQLIALGKSGNHNLKMLIFSGDDDSVCSTAGTQEWIYKIAKPMENHLWEAWKADEQTAGFVTHFDLGKDVEATLTFATVHGAGHEVPAYRPMEALELFKTYLSGEW